MRIEIVQLKNIRSHVDTTVPFAKGFNCLVGGLGCGKSSILYAIDFALFGDPIGRSFDYLLREGTDAGKITVQFTQNGKTFRVSRGLRRRGKGINQDSDELKLFEEETVISSSKNEAVAEQLKAITGLDKELFREVIWVRQEQLKDFLNITPRERQKRLDDLFGLSDYETAWTNFAGYQKEYEGEKRAYEKDVDVVGMEKLGIEYDSVAGEFSLAELEMQDLVRTIASAKKTLEEADLNLRNLEEVKFQNDQLRHKEMETQVKLSNVRDALTLAYKEIETKRLAIRNMKERLDSMTMQLSSCYAELKHAGISTDEPIDALIGKVSEFDDNLSKLRGEQEGTLRSMQADEQRISALAKENLCPLCLQNLTEDYRSTLTQRIKEENDQRQARVNQLIHDIAELRQTRNKVSTAMSELQLQLPRIEDLKARIREETDASADANKNLEQKRVQERDLMVQLAAIRKEIGRYDVSGLDSARALKEQAFRQCCLCESELRTKENRKNDLANRLDDMKERIDKAQQKIERMHEIAKAFEIISMMREAYRSIQPKLRSEFVKVLKNYAQQVLDSLLGGEGPFLNLLIDETYTPYVKSESGTSREVSNLSGGERTLLAFACRLGLGQLIMQSRTGHGLNMLMLDEPTESLGREDGSIDRVAAAISRFKAIEQTIAVTHSEAFAEKAEHVIRLEKEADMSKITVEK